jgi:hypothetical protein
MYGDIYYEIWNIIHKEKKSHIPAGFKTMLIECYVKSSRMICIECEQYRRHINDKDT